MDNSQEKIGFFKRLKIAVCNLENYGLFLGERLSQAFKYFFLLLLLITILIIIAGSYKYYNMLNTAISYVKNELPDFSYNDGTMKFENNVNAYDKEYSFKLYINTDDEISDETLKLYKDDICSVENGVILLKDKIIYTIQKNKDVSDQTNVILEGNYQKEIEENSYSEIFDLINLNSFNKQDLINLIDDIEIYNVVTIYAISNFINVYFNNVLYSLAYLILIASSGYLISRICGIKLKATPLIALSIYSLTLPTIFMGVYNVVYVLIGFYIKHFDVMYFLIAYVYLIAAIFIIKYDLMKQTQELEKILEVQKQVREETQEKLNEKQEEPSKEDEKKKDNKEDNKNEPPVEVPKEEEKEPDGSEI